jgi:hypothetical protein
MHFEAGRTLVEQWAKALRCVFRSTKFATHKMKYFVLVVAQFFVALSFAATSGSPAASTASSCSFDPPLDWKASDVRWVGACSQGRAHGYGVLRYLVNGKVESVFYGRLDKGVVKVGAIDFGGNYRAGDFANGQVIERDADFEGRFRGLEEAAKAAKAAASRFEKTGNRESAKYYRDRAAYWQDSIRD